MNIEIDPHAGFCFGVARAVEQAEGELAFSKSLFCLGEIVHNQEETQRLSGKGLQTIDHKEFGQLKNTTVLIRAHGEPPETYQAAGKNNIKLIEATCPVVLKLQQRVLKAWIEMKDAGGSVVIAGKRNHPEVTGLSGQTNHQAIIAESVDDLERIDFSKPVRLFAQTTFNQAEFEKIRHRIAARMIENHGEPGDFKSINSICGQVSRRIPKLESFCKKHDVIIFVSGKNSSNGKNLYAVCRTANPKSFHISGAGELEPAWIEGATSIGISGATSTPAWLMEEVALKILDYKDVSKTD